MCEKHPKFLLDDVYQCIKEYNFIDFKKLLYVISNFYRKERFHESFGRDQIITKHWLVESMNNVISGNFSILITAGWHGLTSLMLKKFANFSINKLLSIDKNNICTNVCQRLEVNADTIDMFEMSYDGWDIIINTSCEHIDIKKWLDLIPKGKILVLQSTDLYWWEDHINPVESLKNFKKQVNLSEIIFEEEREKIVVDDISKFKRFLIIGKK
jgi:hypothetical protein